MTRGDLYLVLVPFSDGSGIKPRPCVVISTDESHRIFDDVTIVPVTSKVNRLTQLPTQVLIDVTTPDGIATKLIRTSVVRCEKITTLHHSLMGRKLGIVPPTILRRIDRALERALGL